MKVLVVAKTRRGSGACVGAITEKGKSVRLIAADQASDAHAGLEYEVGEVWEIDSAPARDTVPPHVENVIVTQAQRLRTSTSLEKTIRRFMPPVPGGPEKLFDGLVQSTSAGSLYLCERTGLPRYSTMFWEPDRPLTLDCEGKRIRYRYPTPDGGRTLTFVGFQEPVPQIPAGTLLRVSLAHPWRPDDEADQELRCYVQLSGWFFAMPDDAPSESQSLSRLSTPAAQSPAEARAISASDLRTRALSVLKHTFGFSEFYPLQWEVIQRVLNRKHTLVVMPTGGGKSLCYQLPALLLEGLTVVVSPLVALMRDQVTQLRQIGAPAACLNHLVALRNYASIMRQVATGQIRLLYLAPETLLRPEILLMLERSRVECIAIDEAHCISEWGHDFRPEYRKLAPLRSRFPGAVWLALTATATGRVREDIRRVLGIPSEGEFVGSFNRENLFLRAEPRRDCLPQLLAFLQPRCGQSGIVYCGKRRQADELCAQLNANGWPAVTYHAGMEGGARNRNQEQFVNDDVPIVVATVAFGMGINKSNVRFVVHAHMPKDLESYYQEIGRAGRDGLPADCLLLYSRGDAVLHRRFIDQGAASERMGRQARLEAMLNFAEADDCRRVPLLAYFGENLGSGCGNCDNCARVAAPPSRVVDRTREAVQFLSCVRGTDQIFGQEHLIQILRGSQSERIRRKRHDQLPMYGTGKERTAREWQTLATNLIRSGLLERDLQFGSLRLTAKGYDVLEGKQEFQVAEQLVEASVTVPSPGPVNTELLQKLKALRKRLADEARVPAFIIFSDRSLLDMASRLPRNEEQFLDVHGVGSLKLANYGSQFLALISEHGDGSPRPLAPAPGPDRLSIRRQPGCRGEELAKLLANGQTLDEIAAAFGIQRQTVAQHLHRHLKAGGRIDPAAILAQSRLATAERAAVFAAFHRLGADRLGPIYEALGDSIPYDELHLLRLHWLAQAGPDTARAD